MNLLYDLIFFVISLIYLPVYLFRRKFYKGFLSRLGFLPADLRLNKPIWIHAVSAGEIMSMRSFIGELRKTYPERSLVISTVTLTGNRIARGIVKQGDFVTFLPLDFSFIVWRVIKRINPCVVIIAETELWPNFISCLHKSNIPIIVVNARISDRSFAGYSKVRFLLKSILNKISLFCCQTDTDAQRLVSLGVGEDRVRVSGNMKFDVTDDTDKENAEDTEKKKIVGLQDEDKLWVAASTHPGEEEIVLSVYKRVLADYPQFRLLIAPRHPERVKEIEKLVDKYNFQAICMSRQESKRDSSPDPDMTSGGLRMTEGSGTASVFILDTIGELMDFYRIADIVFVGGSLIKKGGHNILEPAVLAKPIIFGPYMFNFRDIADLFLKHNAGILVHNQDELEKTLRDLLNNPQSANELGEKAKGLVEKNRGATLRNMGYITNSL